MSSKSVYVGFEVRLPGVVDPHITIAFIPIPEQPENSHPIDRDHTYEAAFGAAQHLFKALEGRKFSVRVLGFESFGENGDMTVQIVELPSQIEELVSYFRSALYMKGIVYSTRFPFKPHVTLGDFEGSIPETLEVTGLFIDNGDQRHVLHLK